MAKIYLEQQANDKAWEFCSNIISLGDTIRMEELSFAYYWGAKLQANWGLA